MSEAKSTELSQSQKNELIQYHNTLKQFLSMSVAAKTNPARAVKAREKLLKLSPSQFFELSTDAYDELTRRMDESTDEPNFLLPKSTFHPRRNEAREKLGSLQAARFRDLASDILYEVERRNYHILTEEKPHSLSPRKELRNSQTLTLNDTSDQGKDAIVALQSATVIPTKADMDWGSDDEESLLKSPVRSEKRQSNDSNQRSNKSAVVSPPRSPVRTLSKSPTQHQYQDSYGSIDEFDNSSLLGSNYKNMKSNTPGNISRGLSIGKGRNKDREIELLLQEGTKMDRTITELEQKNTLLQTKSDKFEQEAQELKSLNEALNSKIQSLEKEVQEKQRRLSRSLREQKNNEDALVEVKKEKSLAEETSIEELKKEATELKARFDELKLKKIEDLLTLDKISEKNIQSVISKNGLVPTSLLAELRESVQKFLLDLNRSKRSSKPDVNELFSNISRVSKTASKIASLSPLNEKAELIRAAISHTITSARYFAVYPDLLPKLVIESAVSEISFSVFEFIADVKLSKDDYVLSESPSQPNERNLSFTSKNEEVSPVRPLRMGKKSQFGSLNNSPTQSSEFESTTSPSLTIDSHVVNESNEVGKKPFNLGNKDSPLRKTSQASTPMKTGFPSVVSGFSPDISDREVAPAFGLRKSSSSNILSKVKQFEQQAESTTTSPGLQKPVISQLQSSIVDKFGGRKVSGGIDILNDIRPKDLTEELEQMKEDIDVPTLASSSKVKSSNESPISVVQSPPQTEKTLVQPFQEIESNGIVKEQQLQSPLKDKIPESYDAEISQPSSPVSLRKNNDSANTRYSQGSLSEANQQNSENAASDSSRALQSISAKSQVSLEPIATPESSTEESFSTFDLKREISENNNILKQFSPTSLKKQASLNRTWNKSPATGSSTTTSSKNTAAASSASATTEESTVEKKVKQSLTAAFTETGAINSSGENSNEEGEKEIRGDERVEVVYGVDNKAIPLKANNDAPLKLNNDVVNPVIPQYNTETIKSPIVNKKKTTTESNGDYSTSNTTKDDLNAEEKIGSSSFRGKSSNLGNDIRPAEQVIRPQVIEVPDNSKYSDEAEEEAEDGHDEDESDGEERPHTKDRTEDEFDVKDFDIEDPDNTLSELLLYLEHQTVKVISTIQTLLTSIKTPESSKGELRAGSRAIDGVVSQMVEATSISMKQSRNTQLRAHGSWVVESLTDAGTRMMNLCSKDMNSDEDDDDEYADKQFKQRLAGIAFDVAKSTKELVKSVEEANLKEEIEHLNTRLFR